MRKNKKQTALLIGAALAAGVSAASAQTVGLAATAEYRDNRSNIAIMRERGWSSSLALTVRF